MEEEIKPHNRINKHLKEGHPKAVKKAKKMFILRFPKLFLLILSIVLAYLLFKNPEFISHINNLGKYSYFGVFFAGMLAALGFTTPFAIGFFMTTSIENIFLASIIGGLGAVLADYIIFKTIRLTFMDEFEEMEKTRIAHKIKKIFKENFSVRIRHYLVYIFAGIMIATPLPDEMGVTMLAGLTTIKPSVLSIFSFILHTLGIFGILILVA